jgi:TatD DNase family protein
MIDTHCHLDAPEFDHDRESVWARARSSGVEWAVVPAVAPVTWEKTVACARVHERYVALGIHPRYLADVSDLEVDEAMQTLGRSPGEMVAVGECGLDGSTPELHATLERQKKVFLAHAEVARVLRLPMIVHVFRAHGEAMAAMRAVRFNDEPGVIHSFSGSAELAREYMSMGWHIAMGGSVTRPNARRPIEAVRAVSRERLLVETDAPDQVPTGVDVTVRRCEPGHLGMVVNAVAKARGETVSAVIDATTRNAERLFLRRLGEVWLPLRSCYVAVSVWGRATSGSTPCGVAISNAFVARAELRATFMVPVPAIAGW